MGGHESSWLHGQFTSGTESLYCPANATEDTRPATPKLQGAHGEALYIVHSLGFWRREAEESPTNWLLPRKFLPPAASTLSLILYNLELSHMLILQNPILSTIFATLSGRSNTSRKWGKGASIILCLAWDLSQNRDNKKITLTSWHTTLSPVFNYLQVF